jgi:hypothetical protein
MSDLARQQTEDALWRDAKAIPQRQQNGAAALEVQESELKTKICELRTRLADIQLQRKAASLAPQRLAHYAPMSGDYYQCPRCWIADENTSRMSGMDAHTTADILRCDICRYECIIRPVR